MIGAILGIFSGWGSLLSTIAIAGAVAAAGAVGLSVLSDARENGGLRAAVVRASDAAKTSRESVDRLKGAVETQNQALRKATAKIKAARRLESEARASIRDGSGKIEGLCQAGCRIRLK